tara:strand:+ start:5891 stop:7132 length:1242 start_codon:yes stop_codon:yes gene_type:complete
MAIISGVVLGIGKVVSGVVTGTAKGLAVAGKATAKGISATGKVVGKAASATGKAARASARAIGKATRSTAKGLQKAVKSTKRSMSKFRKFRKRISKRKTGAEKLKRNANKIKSELTKNIKKIKKQRLDRERIQKNVLERKEIRNMEKNINSPKTSTGKKVQSILKSPMIIIDKIFGLGGILLTGIIVNAIDEIFKKFKEFKETYKEVFNFLGNIVEGIGNFLGSVKISKLEKEGLKMDELAVFNEEGDLIGGKLVAVKKTTEGFYHTIKSIKDSMGIYSQEEVKRETSKKLEKYGFDPEKYELGDSKRQENNPWWQWWDFMDVVPNPYKAPMKLKKINSEQSSDSSFNESITPINNNNSNNLDLSFNTDNENITIVLAHQTEIEYVMTPYSDKSFKEGLKNNSKPELSKLWTT